MPRVNDGPPCPHVMSNGVSVWLCQPILPSAISAPLRDTLPRRDAEDAENQD
jgi:hypothetical protein